MEIQTPTTDASKEELVKKTLSEEAGKQDGAPKVDEVLSVLNQTLKREFTSRDEAIKSIANLNSLVGDNAVAELRTKAEDAKHFESVVKAYAEAEGLNVSEARRQVLMDLKAKEPQTTTAPKKEADPLLSEIQSLKLKIQEKELLEAYPEAKAVLKELKDLSQIYSGKELKEIYEGSPLKDMASKVTLYDKEKETKATTSVNPTTRQVNFEEQKLKELAANVQKRGYESDKSALVEAYFKQIGA